MIWINIYINSIGNLCLISNEQNSSLGKWDYNQKKLNWENFRKKYSLKQALVFTTYSNWGEKEIEKHNKETIDLLKKYKNINDIYSIIKNETK